jgi:hypothetical protein
MQPTPEFAEEYTVRERVRFVLLGVLIGALLVAACKLWFFPWLKEFSAVAPCRTVFGVNGLTVLWYGLFVGLPLHAAVLVGVTSGWRGYKVLRDGQCPPVGERVFRPTHIRRGSAARRIGYWHLGACLPLLALALWGGLQASDMARASRTQISSCGVGVAGLGVAVTGHRACVLG